MSRRERRTFTAAFKTKVVLEALKERHTMSELAQMHELHPNQITTWKKEFLQGAERVFEQPVDPDRQRLETERDELHRQLGQLTVEVNWLKKKLL